MLYANFKKQNKKKQRIIQQPLSKHRAANPVSWLMNYSSFQSTLAATQVSLEAPLWMKNVYFGLSSEHESEGRFTVFTSDNIEGWYQGSSPFCFIKIYF